MRLRRRTGSEPQSAHRGRKLAATAADALVSVIAPHKREDGVDLPGPNIITHERVVATHFTLKTPFGTINANSSTLDVIRPQRGKGMEVIHVVDSTSGRGEETGIETVMWRFPVGFGWRVEIQTPAVYGGPGGASGPISARIWGAGLTKDVVDNKSHETGSFTFEFKILHDDVENLAALVVPGTAQAICDAIKTGTSSGVAHAVGQVIAGSVPIISVLLAVSSVRWAIRRLSSPTQSPTDKAIAVAHAISDAARVVFPFPATIANVALLAISLGVGWYQKGKRWKKERAARLETGPPSSDAQGAPSDARRADTKVTDRKRKKRVKGGAQKGPHNATHHGRGRGGGGRVR